METDEFLERFAHDYLIRAKNSLKNKKYVDCINYMVIAYTCYISLENAYCQQELKKAFKELQFSEKNLQRIVREGMQRLNGILDIFKKIPEKNHKAALKYILTYMK